MTIEEPALSVCHIDCAPDANSAGSIELSQSKVVILGPTDSQNQHQILESFSRMKFGSVPDLNWWGDQLATKMISTLETRGKLWKTIQRATNEGEFIYVIAPGVRNVISASNRLMQLMLERVNLWLTNQRLNTLIHKPLTRLGSGIENYATLSASERANRHKSTKSLIPRSDFEDYSIHVLFVDDVRVTGTTAARARQMNLSAGAASFQELYAVTISNSLSQRQTGIEQGLNQFFVSGHLDRDVALIVSHEEYQPVQRMLRLLLHPQNRADLPDFMETIPRKSLERIYFAAMSNDYLWIHQQDSASSAESIGTPSVNSAAESGLGLYGASLRKLESYLFGICN